MSCLCAVTREDGDEFDLIEINMIIRINLFPLLFRFFVSVALIRLTVDDVADTKCKYNLFQHKFILFTIILIVNNDITITVDTDSISPYLSLHVY